MVRGLPAALGDKPVGEERLQRWREGVHRRASKGSSLESGRGERQEVWGRGQVPVAGGRVSVTEVGPRAVRDGRRGRLRRGSCRASCARQRCGGCRGFEAVVFPVAVVEPGLSAELAELALDVVALEPLAGRGDQQRLRLDNGAQLVTRRRYRVQRLGGASGAVGVGGIFRTCWCGSPSRRCSRSRSAPVKADRLADPHAGDHQQTDQCLHSRGAPVGAASRPRRVINAAISASE